MNTDLISFLKKQSHYIALPVIEEKLELERETIFSDVEALIEQGYSIEFHPYLGLKLIDIPDRLLKLEIRDDLNTRQVGRKIEIYEQLSSTN
jgi:BirA family biotin operon repressor/biotin-[acetyl-CoA-carboxylase] ligase